MEDEDELKEYVIRQSGAIYVGSYRSPTPKQWYFGQVRNFSCHWSLSMLSENIRKSLVSCILFTLHSTNQLFEDFGKSIGKHSVWSLL